MKKLLTIIGARPQIIKASAVSRAIGNHYRSEIQEVMIHTGQHYDECMSDIFFTELQIPKPDYNLQVGSGKHGEQTARMISGIEEILLKEKPDFLNIYGDTNSTLAGAIAAVKIHIPIVHIEAGLRSFNKKMPEEINRIVSDHVSTYLFPPTKTGYRNLINEGFKGDNLPPYTIDNPCIFNVGDVMYDNTIFFNETAGKSTSILKRHCLTEASFVLVTLHRNTNTDDATRLNILFRALLQLAQSYAIKIVLPLHPRTVKQMDLLLETGLLRQIKNERQIMLLPPVSFLEMIQLERGARLVITDSGGVQKEAFFLNKPCIVMRSETEWVEIVENGAAVLCDADPIKLLSAYEHFEKKANVTFEKIFGDGHSAEKILDILLR